MLFSNLWLWFLLSQILRLQSSLEESQLNEKQLKHKLEMQTETLNNKMEELRALNEHTQSSMTSEMIEVQMKITELENVKVSDLQGKVLQTAHSHSDSVIIETIQSWAAMLSCSQQGLWIWQAA